MKKENVKIIDYDINGLGIAKVDNQTIFVENAIKNEVCDIEIYKQKKNNIAFAKTIEIKKKSDKRTQPLCPYFSVCGGCNLQHICYDEQLEIKTQSVKRTLEKALKQKITCEEKCVGSEKNFAYRNKLDMPIRDGQIGFFKKNSHNLIPVQSCALSEDWNKKVIFAVDKFIKENKISTYNTKTRSGNLHHLTMRYIDNELTLVLVVRENVNSNNFSSLIKDLQEAFGEDKVSLFLNINPKTNSEILTTKFVKIFGKDSQILKEDFLVCEISPYSFLQVNSMIKNLIYGEVVKSLLHENVVINLYSGAGHLTALCAKNSKFAYGIEIAKTATENADKLKKKNKIFNMENICGDCEVEFEKLINKLSKNNKEFLNNFVLVLDPARSGVSKNVIETINKTMPQKIIYISCNPATLARDISGIKNYSIEAVKPFDMFPQISHIETVVILNKNK